MVFKEIIDIWKKESILNQCLKESHEMFSKIKVMYRESVAQVIGSQTERRDEDIHQKDITVNKIERGIRRKVLEHLSINPQQDVTQCLILINVARDLERIGDYSKNLDELALLCPKNLCPNFSKNKYGKKLALINEGVMKIFDLTEAAYKKSSKSKAKKAMELKAEISKKTDALVIELMNDGEKNVKNAIVFALMARYYKRVASHLANIASSVINPFHRLGYRHRKKDEKIMKF